MSFLLSVCHRPFCTYVIPADWARKLVRVFHRAELQKLLASRLKSTNKIHFGKRLTKYDAAADSGGDGHGPITLHFMDGTQVECDLLVGADGVRSAVRRTTYDALADDADRSGNAEEAQRLRAMREPVWSREISYRGLVPAQKLRELGFEDVDAFVNVRASSSVVARLQY